MKSLFLNAHGKMVEQVANYIKRLIVRQGLRPGAPLPSYRELAKRLNVAYATAKRAVDVLAEEGIVVPQHGKGFFVKKAISRKGKKLLKIGLVYTGSRENLFKADYLANIVRGIMIVSGRIQADVQFVTMNRDGFVSASQVEDSGVDGVLLVAAENDEYLTTFIEWGIPGIVVDYCSKNLPLDFLACDNRAAARCLVKHLVKLGHTRITYVDGPATEYVRHMREGSPLLLVCHSSDVVERREETVNALNELELVTNKTVVPAGDDINKTISLFPDLWRRDRERPTALIACDEYIASSLIKAFAARGVKVPEDISICAVAAAGDAVADGKRLTCCKFDFMEMGRSAVEILKQRCEDPGKEAPGIHRIGCVFVEGDTTRRALKI